MNNQGLKKIIRLLLAVAVIFLVVKWCSGSFGNVITLPGGLGQGSSTTNETTTGGGNTTTPSTGGSITTSPGTVTGDIENMDAKDLEKQLGIGKNKGQSTTTTTTTTPSTTTTTTASASSPLSFKGIPMSGTLSAFGSELVKAGFRSAGNGTYIGDFAGYSGCKVTPSGSNPVQEVRIDFPVISDWDALEKAYDSLQASLTQKYGMQPRTTSGNNVAVYDLPNGAITLDADVSDRSSWHVILKYTNAYTPASTGTLGRNPIDDL